MSRSRKYLICIASFLCIAIYLSYPFLLSKSNTLLSIEPTSQYKLKENNKVYLKNHTRLTNISDKPIYLVSEKARVLQQNRELTFLGWRTYYTMPINEKFKTISIKPYESIEANLISSNSFFSHGAIPVFNKIPPNLSESNFQYFSFSSIYSD